MTYITHCLECFTELVWLADKLFCRRGGAVYHPDHVRESDSY